MLRTDSQVIGSISQMSSVSELVDIQSSPNERFQASPEKSRLAGVALTTKRNDALHASPDELREIWAWLDRWEQSYLPGH